MPAKGKQNTREPREIPPIFIILGIVLIVMVVGIGGYYAYNGGWKTEAMQDDTYKHEIGPILAAKHGDREGLDAENKLRQEHGQAPLEMPKEKKSVSSNDRQKLLELQQKLQGKQGNSPPQ